MHEHPDHDLVDLVVLETELMTDVVSGFAQESTELLQPTLLLLLGPSLRWGDFTLKVHALACLRLCRGGRLERSPAGASLLAVLVLMLTERFSDHFGGKEEMVVVNDDQISGLVNLGHLVGEKLVHLHVAGPRWVRSRKSGGSVEPEEVVEQRPKG